MITSLPVRSAAAQAGAARRPAFGLAIHVWQRHRWGLSTFVAYLAVLAAVVRFIPPAYFPRHDAGPCTIPLMFGLIFLMAAFMYPEGDVTSGRSGFPPYKWVLPVRTRTLVIAPMALGAAAVASAWSAVAGLILRPAGWSVPILWPASMLAAVLACLQALFWMPFGLPYLRIAVAMVTVPALVTIGMNGSANGASESVLALGFLCLIPPAALLAIAGVSRARRGDELSWSGRVRFGTSHPATSTAAMMPRAFSSTACAQFWLEWRRNGIVLPAIVGAACILFTLPVLGIHETGPLATEGPMGALASGAGGTWARIAAIETHVWIRCVYLFLLFPPLFGLAIGGRTMRAEMRTKDLALHPFLAVRPMTSGDLIAAKLRMAAFSTLSAWAIVLVFMAGWMLVPARDGHATGPLGLLIWRCFTPKTGPGLLLAMLALIVWTWKNQVQTLFLDYTGRPWIVHTYPTAYACGYTALIVFAFDYLPQPGVQAWLLHNLLRLLAAGVGLKIGISAWALFSMVRAKLAAPRTIALLAAGWGLAAAATVGILQWMLPADAGAIGYRALIIVLSLPAARIALAPVALEWSRHA